MSDRKKRAPEQMPITPAGRYVGLGCTGRGEHRWVRLWTLIDRRGWRADLETAPVGSGITVLNDPQGGDRGALGWSVDRARSPFLTYILKCPKCRSGVEYRFSMDRLPGLLDDEYEEDGKAGKAFALVKTDVSGWTS